MNCEGKQILYIKWNGDGWIFPFPFFLFVLRGKKIIRFPFEIIKK